MAAVGDRVVGQVDGQVRVLHILALLGRFRRGRSRSSLIAAQHGLDPGYQLLGVEGLDHVVIGAQLQSQDLIKNFALGGKHDDRHLGGGPQLTAHLVAVDARKHQIQQDQVRLKFREDLQGFLAVIDNIGFVAFFHQIERNQLCDVLIIIYNQNPLLFSHVFILPIYLNTTMVTPASPSPKPPRWNSLIYLSRFKCLWMPARSAPVPLPCTMRTCGRWAM